MPRNANQSKSSNYSMDFDGSQYIDTNQSLSSSYSALTLSAWVNYTTLTSLSGTIFGQWIQNNNSGSTILCYTASNKIQVYLGPLATPLVSTTTLTTGTWYNVILRFDGSTMKLYINGAEEDSVSFTSINNSARNLILGAYSNSAQTGYQGYLNGKLDEVCIFDYALSPSQVATLWGGGTSVSNPMALPTPPIAYYPLGTSAWNGEYLAENNAIGDYVFDFDAASSNKIEVSNNTALQITGDITISAWVYAESQNGRVVSKRGGGGTNYDFYIESRYLRLYDGGTGPFSTGRINLNEWSHILISVNSGTGTYYINNAFAGTGTFSISSVSTSQPFYIGGSYTPVLAYFNGKLSNVQIFNTALTEPEVETLYNYGSPIRTLANIPQSSNLKAWYKLDASEVYNNTTTEWSVDNNQNPSAYPSSLDFDASSSDYIQIPYNVNLTPQNGNFTISAWINTDNLSGWHPIWCTQNLSSGAINVALHTFGNKVRATVGGSTNNPSYPSSWALLLDSTESLTTSTWYHIAVSYDMSGDAQIYINGNPDNSGPIENPQTNWDTGDRFIGEGEGYWDGRISNLSIWNTALTSPQVTEIYNNGTPSNLSSHSATSNLVSWWKLNNTTTGIEDAKGSNNGTNYGATEYTGFVNTLAGESSGMTQANLVQSDLQTAAPYSKYAMSFDAASTTYVNVGNDSSLNLTSQMSASIWAKPTGTAQDVYTMISNFPQTYKFSFYYYRANSVSSRILILRVNASGSTDPARFDTYVDLSDGNWHHLAFTVDGTTNANGINVYVDGAKLGSFTASDPGINSNTSPTLIGSYITNSTWDFDGYLSNASIWDTALTEAQITEIYNEGLPGNLNSHSAYSNLVSWWQLGENSSFDGNNWICADEKGTNNGISTGMPVGALVNGVGTTANGVSSGMSEGNLVGDAPYSTANAVSSGMAVTAKGTDVP